MKIVNTKPKPPVQEIEEVEQEWEVEIESRDSQGRIFKVRLLKIRRS
jgi:hypothetical protein